MAFFSTLCRIADFPENVKAMLSLFLDTRRIPKSQHPKPAIFKNPPNHQVRGNGINQFTFWGELVFSLPKSANNPFSKGLAF